MKPKSQPPQTRSERWLARLKETRLVAALIVLTTLVGGLAVWADAAKKIQGLLRPGQTASVSFDCEPAVMPLAVSAEQPLHLLDAAPSLLNGIATIVSANPIKWPSPNAFGMAHRCEFKNLGNTPASLNASFEITFREVHWGSSPGVGQVGKVVSFHEHRVLSPILEVPNGKFVFYLINRTASFVEVKTPEDANALTSSNEKQKIRLAKTNRTSFPLLLSPWPKQPEARAEAR